MSEWIKRKTRTMVECDKCKALICWNKMNGAKYDEYWQKGNGKILCPDCFRKLCDWCKFKHNEYLFRQIEALNGEYPKYCPWCGNKLSI